MRKKKSEWDDWKLDYGEKHNCRHQVCECGIYCCKLVQDRQEKLNEKNDDVKYGGVYEQLDDRCHKKRGCGYERGN